VSGSNSVKTAWRVRLIFGGVMSGPLVRDGVALRGTPPVSRSPRGRLLTASVQGEVQLTLDPRLRGNDDLVVDFGDARGAGGRATCGAFL
jgi:hypothetical protein